MHTSALSRLARALVLSLLLCVAFHRSVRAFDDELLHELASDDSVRTSDGLVIELPSRQQRDALITESPTLLLARSRLSERLFALDARDGVAHVDGRGRMGRSGKISITRGMPLAATRTAYTHDANDKSNDHDDEDDDEDDPFASTEAPAIAFGPEELAIGTRVTCEPTLWYINVINRGRASVRLDAIEFTRSGYELLSTVDGAVLAPSTHATIAVVLTLSDPEPQYEAFMRVFTSAGTFTLRITAHVTLHPLGVREIRAIVPLATAYTATLALRNPTDALIRVVDVFSRDALGSFALPNGATAMTPRSLAQPGGPRMGVWDVPAHSTRAIVDYTFSFDTPGVCLSYVRMRLSSGEELAIPVTIEVVRPGVYMEPSRVALGAFTAHDAVREVLIDLFNAADEAIEVAGVDVRTRSMDVTVSLTGPTILPPKTRVQQALRIHAQPLHRDSKDECVAVLALRTNVSMSSELVLGELLLSGVQIHGSIAYAVNETLVGVTTSLQEALGRDVAPEDDSHDDDPPDAQRSSAFQTSRTFANGSIVAVEAGATAVRALHLRNLYNVPLELERVWVADDESAVVVTVEAFEPSVAASGAYWKSPVVLHVTPLRRPDAFATSRVVILIVETHLVTLQVPLYVFYGTLQLGASTRNRPITTAPELARPGYLPATKARGTKASRVCLPVDAAASRASTKRSTTARDARVKLCRSVVLDVGKVSRHGVRDAVLHLTNVNPIALDVKVASVLRSELYDLTVRSELSPAPHAPVHVAAIGQHDAHAARTATMLNSVVTLDAAPKANKRLHDTVVVPPGYDYAITLSLHARDVFGSFTKYVLTLETPSEFVHVHVRFESVDGVVQPVVPAFSAQPMFPGRVALVYFQYASTFAHDVAVRGFTFPASAVQIVSMSSGSFAGATPSESSEGVSYMTVSALLSPSYRDACAQSLYLADCDLPHLAAHAQTHALSRFGDNVSYYDLVQFERRQSAWQAIERSSDPSLRPRLNVSIVLSTTIMDAAAVQIVAPLVRAAVSTANLSETFAEVAFGRTKVLERQERRVRVHNPSSVSIDMELAVSFHEHALFYHCHARDTSACLADWEAAVVESATCPNASVAPFFVVQRVVRVPMGEDAELGPIYFFPSHELEVESMIFVRSELTHIEPVMLSATSGRGVLDVRVATDASALEREEIKAVDDAIDSEDVGRRDTERYDDDSATRSVIQFVMSASDAASFETQERVVELLNVGTYDLVVARAGLVHDNDDRSDRPFAVAIDRLQTDEVADAHDTVVLAPGERLHVRVVYVPNCFVARSDATLEIVTDASATPVRVPLVAFVRPTASFACLRAQLPPALVSFALVQWRFAVGVALVVALSSVVVTLESVWTLHQRSLAIQTLSTTALAPLNSVETLNASFEADTLSVALPPSSDDACDSNESALSRLLDEIEASAFVPVARVETPAVTRLLLERQRRSALAAKSEAPRVVTTSSSDATAKVPVAPASASSSSSSPAVATATLAAPVHPQAPVVPAPASSITKASASNASVAAAAPVVLASTKSTPQTADATRSGQASAVASATTPAAAPTAPVIATLTAKASKKTPSSAKTKDESVVSTRVVAPAPVAPPSKDAVRLNGASTVLPRGRKGAREAPPLATTSSSPPPSRDPAPPTKTSTSPSTSTSSTSLSSLLPPKPATPKTKRYVASDKPVASATETPARRTTNRPKQLSVTTSKAPSPRAKAPLETLKRSAIAASLVASPIAVPVVTVESPSAETPTPVTAKRAARPSSSSRSKRALPHEHTRDVPTPLRAPSSSLSPLSVDTHEAVSVLASSIDSTSTSTTVSFDSDDAKLSPPAKTPAAAETDDFFLSMTFEAPFSSFGAIGKTRRSDHPLQSPPPCAFESAEDTDAVLVERFGARSSPDTTAATTTNGVQANDADDDDWSDLYFDSIRSEIGRLVASSESSSSSQRLAKPSGFASLHETPPPRVFALDAPSPVAASTPKAAPPGFSPADANPLASLAAFERLRSTSASAPPPLRSASASDASSLHNESSSSRFAFASRLSLFGPSLAPPSSPSFRVALDRGDDGSRIAANRSTTSGNDKASRDWTLAATPQDARTALASLGGIELVPTPHAAMALSTSAASSSSSSAS